MKRMVIGALRWMIAVLIALEVAWQFTSPAQHRFLIISAPEWPWPYPEATSLVMGLAGQLASATERLSDDSLIMEHALDSLEQAAIDDQQTRAIEHWIAPTCGVGESSTESQQHEPQQVYTWTDAQGRVHFGDTAPDGQSVDLSDRYAQPPGVSLQFEHIGGAADLQLEQQFERDARLLYRLVSQWIPLQQTATGQNVAGQSIPQRQNVSIGLTLYQDSSSFRERTDTGLMPAYVAGFYQPSDNRIHLQRQNSDDATLALARHEISHALLAQLAGVTPVWLNEGLARYAERMTFEMSAASVALGATDISRLRRLEQQSALEDLLQAGPAAFYRSGESAYHQAFGLVYFLNDHQTGRGFLRQLLQEIAESPCQPGQFSKLQQNYPGGLQQLVTDYRQWLRNAADGQHRY